MDDGILTYFRAVWDARAFKKPIAVREGLTVSYPRTNAVFSPDDRYVVTGCGPAKTGEPASLVFMKKENLEVVKRLAVASTPVKVLWHPKLNQVCAKKIHCSSFSLLNDA